MKIARRNRPTKCAECKSELLQDYAYVVLKDKPLCFDCANVDHKKPAEKIEVIPNWMLIGWPVSILIIFFYFWIQGKLGP